MKYRRKGYGDFRSAIFVASFAVLLMGMFVVLMAAYDVPDVGDRARTPPVARAGSEPVLPATYDIERDGIPVLCHHFLRENSGPLLTLRILGALFLNLPLLDDMDVWTQTVDAFERQMQYLHEQGYRSIDLDDVIAWQEGSLELPPKCVVITFDDGDRSVQLAAPILERYGFTATLFITTDKVGKTWEGIESLDWDELWELQMSGRFSIQSHTHDLHYHVKTPEGRMPAILAASRGFYDMPGAKSWQRAVFEDLHESRRVITQRLGTIPRFLAWPYGFADSELDSIAVAAGFRASCTLELGTNKRTDRRGTVSRAARWPGSDPRYPATIPFYRARKRADTSPEGGTWERFEVRRYTITARTTTRAFREMMAGRPQ